MGTRPDVTRKKSLDLVTKDQFFHYHYHHHHHQYSHPQSHHQHHGIRALNLIIIISLISIFLLFAVFLIILLLRRLKSAKANGLSKSSSNNSNNNKNDKLRKFSTDSTTITFNASPDVKNRCIYGGSLGRIPTSRFIGVQVFTYKEIESATNSFSEANVIGKGRFGVVYRGILSNGTVAAIKKLDREGKQGGEREFRIQVDLLSRLHSSYLVELLGYCADQQHRILVFEFMPNGSLQQHLHPSHKQHQPLNWGTRLRIALDCARALEFLHENAVPSIIHRDFKCTNIVLDHNFRAKVSDLGLAKTVSDKINGQISMPVIGTTTGYLAPEYASTGKLSTKADVYSYGVVLLELITGRIPVDTIRPTGEHILVSWALPRLTNREKVIEMVDPALQGQFSKKELIQVAAIAAVCVQQEADYRPLMTDVVQSLVPLVKSLSTSCPSNSFRFNSRTVSPRS
ncbi:Protein kinase domain [Macleaya cordata]|uniref:Protein kinase domain n=1 Tax=Macleaya cordata TaxID=56857 RepID=A0A200RBI8_MACCD|nr:Protein kinase domain [Macleaya cordata]